MLNIKCVVFLCVSYIVYVKTAKCIDEEKTTDGTLSLHRLKHPKGRYISDGKCVERIIGRVYSVKSDLPHYASIPFIEPCHHTDEKCLISSSNKALPFVVNGIPEIGMPSLNPLVLKKANGNNGELKLTILNLVVDRLKECKINKVELNEKLKMFVDLDCPLSVSGEYIVDGKLYLISLYGQGAFGFKTEKMNIKLTVTKEIFEKEGISYYKFKKLDYSYEPIEKATFKFDNLFNGDATKAEPIIKMLDEAWKEMTVGVGGPLVGEIITHIVNAIGSFIKVIPLNEIELS